MSRLDGHGLKVAFESHGRLELMISKFLVEEESASIGISAGITSITCLAHLISDTSGYATYRDHKPTQQS